VSGDDIPIGGPEAELATAGSPGNGGEGNKTEKAIPSFGLPSSNQTDENILAIDRLCPRFKSI